MAPECVIIKGNTAMPATGAAESASDHDGKEHTYFMKIRKIIPLLLIAALLLPLFAACGESAQNSDAPSGGTSAGQTAPSAGDAETDAPEEDPDAALYTDLPKENFG